MNGSYSMKMRVYDCCFKLLVGPKFVTDNWIVVIIMHSNNTYKHIDDYFQYEIYANYKENTKEMR